MKLDTERLWAEVTAYFGDDTRRIEHARSVLGYAREILADENADRDTVEAAAMLHDIGIHEAERKYNSTAGHHQELEGPPIARDILAGMGADEALIEHVCRIIASHHSPGEVETPEFFVLWDADWLVNIPDEYPDAGVEKLSSIVDKVFRTKKGRELANRFLI